MPSLLDSPPRSPGETAVAGTTDRWLRHGPPARDLNVVFARGTQEVDSKGHRNQQISLRGLKSWDWGAEGDPKQTGTGLEADAVVHHAQLSEGRSLNSQAGRGILFLLATICVFSQPAGGEG